MITDPSEIRPGAAGPADLLFSQDAGGASKSGGDEFNAALKAAQKAEASQAAHDQTMKDISDKGLTAWVAETRMEKLKEELRKKIMAEMGLDENSMAQLDDKIQSILEQKIQEELENRLAALDESNGVNADGAGKSSVMQAAAQPGKNDQDGKKCPVIPALMHPGAGMLF